MLLMKLIHIDKNAPGTNKLFCEPKICSIFSLFYRKVLLRWSDIIGLQYMALIRQ